MEFKWIGLILFAVAYIAGKVGYALGKDKKAESDYDKMNREVDDAVNKENNLPVNLLKRTLEELGCQYEVNDEADKVTISFKYQGEEFVVGVSDDKAIIWISDFSWSGMELNNQDVERLKSAINEANSLGAITTFYTVDNEKGYLVLHSHRVVYFTYHIPDCKEYLKAHLDMFFQSHQHVREVFDKICAGVPPKIERVRVKGFSE